MRISPIQMNSPASGREENVERAREFIARAVADKAEFVVLPEFFNREYFAKKSGGLVASGSSSLYTEWRDRRADFRSSLGPGEKVLMAARFRF